MGIHLPNTGHAGMGYILAAFLRSVFVRQQAAPLTSSPNPADLLVLKELAESGALRPVIDRTYPLSETPAALAYVGTGHVPGKVVVFIP